MLDALDTVGVREPEPQASHPPLGSLLVERGLITGEQLQHALAEQGQSGLPLGQVLIGLGYVTAATVAQALASNFVEVMESHAHPDYDQALNANDIGVLITATPMAAS